MGNISSRTTIENENENYPKNETSQKNEDENKTESNKKNNLSIIETLRDEKFWLDA